MVQKSSIVYEQFKSKKKKNWRAHFRARYARLNMTQNAPKSQFLDDFSNFRRTQRARKCARAKNVFRFGFSIKIRWLTSPAIQSYMCKNPVILQMHCKIKDLHVHKILQLHCFYTCILKISLKCYEFEISLTKTLELYKL